MAYMGMDPDRVEELGRLLKRRGDDIDQLVQRIESRISGVVWEGKDAQDFKGPWWGGHKNKLREIANELRGFGQSALNNASEQRQASGR